MSSVTQPIVEDHRPRRRSATFALVRHSVSESQVRGMFIVDPRDLAAVYVSGHLEVQDGAATRPAGADLADPAVRDTWVGTWEDPGRDLQQHLGADGRYSEIRGGRVDAYTGRYWVRDDRIAYLDDSGFRAFGELVGTTLHHAGFVMDRGSAAPASAGPAWDRQVLATLMSGGHARGSTRENRPCSAIQSGETR